MEADTETFGDRLRRLRRAADLAQRELGELSGVDYSYISRLESKNPAVRRDPSLAAIRKLAAALGVTVEYLETGERHAVRLSLSVAAINRASREWAGPDALAWEDLTLEERQQVTRGLDRRALDSVVASMYAVQVVRRSGVQNP